MREGTDALGIVGQGEVIAPADELTGRRTILDALRDALPDADVRYARGTGISDGTDEEIAAAVAAATASEVAILVLGERSGLTDDSTTGEFRDRLDPGLPRPPAGAVRRGGRDRHAGRARGRQRPAARHRMRSRAMRTRSSSRGSPATPARTRSRAR